MRAINATKGRILAERVTVASAFFSRFVGLMGRRSLPAGEGLHLVPCNGVHTFFMRISIDVVVLDAQHTIVGAIEALRPWRFTRIYPRAHSVLELPAGTLAASETHEGDRVRFEPAKG
jgi:uncharacterized membrane protein (UPF0127 family)